MLNLLLRRLRKCLQLGGLVRHYTYYYFKLLPHYGHRTKCKCILCWIFSSINSPLGNIFGAPNVNIFYAESSVPKIHQRVTFLGLQLVLLLLIYLPSRYQCEMFNYEILNVNVDQWLWSFYICVLKWWRKWKWLNLASGIQTTIGVGFSDGL